MNFGSRSYAFILSVFSSAILIVATGPVIAFASTGVPKKALIITDLSAPARLATVSEIDLGLVRGKCVPSTLAEGSAVLKDANLGQTMTLKLGSETYESMGTAWIYYLKNDPTCPLEASGIRYIHIDVAHTKIKNLRLGVEFNLETNEISVRQLEGYGPSGFGKIIERF